MTYDIVVVGAGPAGSTTARHCAKRGLKTLLLEKKKFPRYKPCGGGVTEQASSLLGFDIKKVIEKECYGVKFIYNQQETEVQTPFKITSFTSRESFDLLLAEEAASSGAEFHDSEAVKSIIPRSESVEVITEKNVYKAKAVVGADGINSRIAAYVRRKLSRDEVTLALEAEVSSNPESLGLDTAVACFGIVPYGYGWVFPKKDSLSVGVGCRLSLFKNPRLVFKTLMQKLNLDEKTPYQAHLIPDGSIMLPSTADRMLLVGDAAGFADPFSGEGITYAIKSGQIAAYVLSKADETGDYNKANLQQYEKICYNTFGRQLQNARRVADVIYKHIDVFGRSLEKSRPLMYKSLEVYSGKITYSDLVRWFLARLPYYYVEHMIQGFNEKPRETKGPGHIRHLAD